MALTQKMQNLLRVNVIANTVMEQKNLYCDNRKCLNMIKVDDVVEQVIKIISR